jgi:2-haloacid dehalogenase
MIKAIFLDVDDTLLDFPACARESLRICFEELGLSFGDREEKVFHEINDGLWRQVEDGTLTRTELYEVRFPKIFEALGISADGKRTETRFRAELCRVAIPMDGARELIDRLGKKYPLYVASNAPDAQQRARLSGAGLIDGIKEIFTSEAIGFSKPAAEFFTACLERAGVRAEEAVMIGDSLNADVSGAKALGIKTLWLCRKGDVSAGKGIADALVESLWEIDEDTVSAL